MPDGKVRIEIEVMARAIWARICLVDWGARAMARTRRRRSSGRLQAHKETPPGLGDGRAGSVGELAATQRWPEFKLF
jgi:hypothetical protein